MMRRLRIYWSEFRVVGVRGYFGRFHHTHLVLIGTALAGMALIGLLEPALAGQVMYCILVVMGFTFTMLYARSNWRVTSSGRAVMYLVGMFTAFVTWVTVSYWLSRYGHGYDDVRDWVRTLLSLGLIVMFVNLVLTLIRIQNSEDERARLDRELLCPDAQQRAQESDVRVPEDD